MSDDPDLSRYADVLAWIDDLGARDDDLLACWVGGSAATGGYDDHSDLDVNVLAAPGTFARVFEDLLASLVSTFAPTSVWRLPDATYADGRQLFATFDDDPGALVGRPASSTSSCTRPPTSTATSTYVATAHRWCASTPTGWSSNVTTTRPSCVAASPRPSTRSANAAWSRSGWSTARSPATTCLRPSRSTSASHSCRWSSCSAPATAPRATTRLPLPPHRHRPRGRRARGRAAPRGRAAAGAVRRVLRLAGRAARHRWLRRDEVPSRNQRREGALVS